MKQEQLMMIALAFVVGYFFNRLMGREGWENGEMQDKIYELSDVHPSDQPWKDIVIDSVDSCKNAVISGCTPPNYTGRDNYLRACTLLGMRPSENWHHPPNSDGSGGQVFSPFASTSTVHQGWITLGQPRSAESGCTAVKNKMDEDASQQWKSAIEDLSGVQAEHQPWSMRGDQMYDVATCTNAVTKSCAPGFYRGEPNYLRACSLLGMRPSEEPVPSDGSTVGNGFLALRSPQTAEEGCTNLDEHMRVQEGIRELNETGELLNVDVVSAPGSF
jgi:hypothetical protein